MIFMSTRLCYGMDESAAHELRELEARGQILKHEIATQRDKLKTIKNRIASDLQFYEDIERDLEALYNEDVRIADRITKIKFENAQG